MYFPVGWPKVLKLPELGDTAIKQITCNRDRILFAILTDESLALWFCKPCVPIVYHRRLPDSLKKIGTNVLVEWKPDSSMLVIGTSEGHLLFYNVGVLAGQKGLYLQTDSPNANLRRDSAELFVKEVIPPLHLTMGEEVMVWDGEITSIVCITMTELMVATTKGHVLRYRWDGTQNRDYNLDLRRIPFCINQQVSKAIPIVEENTYIISMEYSPLVGGFAVALNDGRAAFLTASSLKFDPNQVQGIWAQGIEDATCATVNHKYRLVTFGRANSECVVYYIDESTGGLELSHNCVLSSKDYPGCPGIVNEVKWTPDGCAMAVSWDRGGMGLWSTFGALLVCSVAWDYGLHVDLERSNPLYIIGMEWATEGYHLWMIRKHTYRNTNGTEDKDINSNPSTTTHFEFPEPVTTRTEFSVIQLDFVKSVLTSNPCMSHQSHLFLQGDDRLYVNTASALIKLFSNRSAKDDVFSDSSSNSTLAEGKQWLVIPIPDTYAATNWPVRYAAIDFDGQNVAIAGRTGLAHYSIVGRRWKLFGNETQEKDFIVTGGLLWWRDYIVMGCYSIIDNKDEIRFYPRDCKLDNKYVKIVRVSAPVLLINNLQDQLITFGSDAQVVVWTIAQVDAVGNVEANKIQMVDISALCVHPACVTSITLTSLRTEAGRGQNHNSESIVLNVSGRLLLVQRESKNGDRYTCSMPTVLASCVESVWVPLRRKVEKVLEEEATSKEPIPDAQLPSVIEFIMEFPVYLQTVVQCARKTEIALWPYLFSAAGKPKDLFQECMAKRQLDTAASYLIILQNLETSSVSRQYATLLLDTALNRSKWELSKDLVRFLRAIDPNDVESPRTSFILPGKLALTPQTPPVTPNAEDLSLILGSVQGPRGRSFSTTVTPKVPDQKSSTNVTELPEVVRRKKSASTSSKNNDKDSTAEEFFIDVILQRHARRLLSAHRLSDLGYFAAHLDFHLVTWLGKERERAARIDDFVTALKHLHEEFNWPYPVATDVPQSTNVPTMSTPESPTTIDEHLKSLYIDSTLTNVQQTSSRVGDSGYVSFPGGLPCTGITTARNLESSSQIAESEEEASNITQMEMVESSNEVFLQEESYKSAKNDVLKSSVFEGKLLLLDKGESTKMGERPHGSVVDESMMSTASSVWDGDKDLDIVCNENWEVPTPQVLEQLSNSDTKGSQRSEVQLRYLLQLFMEASCLEWSLLISILLRDAMAVLRTVNAARTSEQSIESISRLRQGLQLLCYWTNRECIGYKTFMLAVQNQIAVLAKILGTKIQQERIQEHQQAISATLTKIMTPIPARSRKSSTNQESTSQSAANKEKLNRSQSVNERLLEPAKTNVTSENEYVEDNSIIPESTGCLIS